MRAEQMEKPNIVLIMSDQHRASVAGYAGDSYARTPHLDKLSNEGHTFENAYCPNPLCVPSRMAFMTGLSTQTLEVWSLADTIREDLVTWPEMLEVEGYETAISGRMHLWWGDKKVGFRKRLFGDTKTMIPNSCRSLWDGSERGQELQKIYRKEFGNYFFPSLITEEAIKDQDREATDCALEYLRDKGRGEAKSPFALCVGYLEPHPPMRTEKKYFDHFKDMPVELERFDSSEHPAFYRDAGLNLGRGVIQEDDVIKDSIRAYYAKVERMDEMIGEIVETLDEQGLLKNTIIIYTSDHGEMLGQKGWWGKRCLYEMSAKVPLIIRDFREPENSQKHKELVSLLDIFPTIQDLSQSPKLEELEGKSLIHLLEEGRDSTLEERAVFSEFAEIGIDQPTAMVRKGRYKLIVAHTYSPVLFDLESDPEEEINLYGQEGTLRIQKELENELYKQWDPFLTRKKILRNQRRTEIHAQSRRLDYFFDN